MRPFTETPPRRRARRPGIVRSLLGLLRPFDGERHVLRERMSPADWRKLAEERGAALIQAQQEADACAGEVTTLRRAIRLADEGKRIAEAGMRHADGERDDAQRISAKWEIEAADLRDRLVEAKRHAAMWENTAANLRDQNAAAEQRAAEALALLDSEREAWREERAGLVRERDAAREENRRLRPLDRENRDLWRKLRACREYVAGAGPRPETLAKLDAILARDPFAADPDPRQGTPGGADLLIGADRQIVPPPPAAAPSITVDAVAGQAVGVRTIDHPAAPEVQVRTVVLDRTPPFVPPPAPEVRPPHDRVPDMSRRPAPAPSDDPVDVAERLVESRLRCGPGGES